MTRLASSLVLCKTARDRVRHRWSAVHSGMGSAFYVEQGAGGIGDGSDIGHAADDPDAVHPAHRHDDVALRIGPHPDVPFNLWGHTVYTHQGNKSAGFSSHGWNADRITCVMDGCPSVTLPASEFAAHCRERHSAHIRFVRGFTFDVRMGPCVATILQWGDAGEFIYIKIVWRGFLVIIVHASEPMVLDIACTNQPFGERDMSRIGFYSSSFRRERIAQGSYSGCLFKCSAYAETMCHVYGRIVPVAVNDRVCIGDALDRRNWDGFRNGEPVQPVRSGEE